MAVRKRSSMFGVTILTVLFSLQRVSSEPKSKTLPLLMPDVQPIQNETYLCTAFKMPKSDFEYIVEFHPNASMQTAHHVLIYGCGLPGRRERDTPRHVWDCGEMSQSDTGYSAGPVCARGSQIIYAWAMEAPALKLPKGVGFKVGAGTGIDYLVLQVHYANVNYFRNGATDNSGIILTLLPSTTKKVTKNAGVYLLGTGGIIPPHRKVHMETACTIDEPSEIHPFAFRTHTHKLGKVVSGYKIDTEGNWQLIGKHNPQEPQMFYPVQNKNLVIRKDDIVAARCTMDNFRDKTVRIGATANDEMCNFYMMYYVDGDKPLSQKYCFTSGPPVYYWNWDTKIGYVPPDIDISASKLN